jgi:hypothetical protein
MIRDDTERDVHSELPSHSCIRCHNPLRYIVIDAVYCSYECAGVPVPDSSEHPLSCWTWDAKPKMGFPTQETAERAVSDMGVPGVKAYYCVIHHFWHVGYSDGRSDTSSEDSA